MILFKGRIEPIILKMDIDKSAIEDGDSKKKLKIVNFADNKNNKPLQLKENSNKIIYLDPRALRHHERIIDLFRILFKRR